MFLVVSHGENADESECTIFRDLLYGEEEKRRGLDIYGKGSIWRVVVGGVSYMW